VTVGAQSVSVIVPVRNGSRTLPLCLPALLGQDYPAEAFEILCVDNGSTDGSVDVMKRYGPRVQILHALRRGASAARNEGVRRSRHPWIAFTDCDCIPEPGWLTAIMRFACGPRCADLMGGPIVAYRAVTSVERFCERLFDQHRAMCEFTPPYAVTANMLAKRDTLAALGLFDESFRRGQDVELSYRAWFDHRATFGFVEDAIVAHVNPNTSMALWRKALQHGEAASSVISKHGERLGCSTWSRCSDWRRYRTIGGLAFRALATGAAGARDAPDPNRDHVYELIVEAGKQVGFVRESLVRTLRTGHIGRLRRHGSGGGRAR